MEFVANLVEFEPSAPVRVGNVYPVKGGRGLKSGHMQVMIALKMKFVMQILKIDWRMAKLQKRFF